MSTRDAISKAVYLCVLFLCPVLALAQTSQEGEWTDTLFYSRENIYGLSASLTLGAGTFDDAYAIVNSDGTQAEGFPSQMNGLALSGRVYYSHRKLPWLQPLLRIEPNMLQKSATEISMSSMLLTAALGAQIRFFHLPFLSPLFFYGEIPLGWAKLEVQKSETEVYSDASGFYGWAVGGGMEFAFSESSSIGLRATYEKLSFLAETTREIDLKGKLQAGQEITHQSTAIRFGFEYRRYLNLW